MLFGLQYMGHFNTTTSAPCTIFFPLPNRLPLHFEVLAVDKSSRFQNLAQAQLTVPPPLKATQPRDSKLLALHESYVLYHQNPMRSKTGNSSKRGGGAAPTALYWLVQIIDRLTVRVVFKKNLFTRAGAQALAGRAVL